MCHIDCWNLVCILKLWYVVFWVQDGELCRLSLAWRGMKMKRSILRAWQWRVVVGNLCVGGRAMCVVFSFWEMAGNCC